MVIKMVDEYEIESIEQSALEQILEEKPAKKTRARKAATTKKEKALNPAAGLLSALKFILPCQKKAGEQQVQFCIINNRWIAASNDILTIATPIAEDFTANAHTYQLIDALSKCKEDLQVVVMSESCLSVKSGDFTGLVSCIGDGILNINGPDSNCASISDVLKPALMATLGLTVENAPNEYLAGVLLQANSCVGTDGSMLFEYWHGVNLPTMLLPRQAAVAIAKCDKPLTGFGYSGPTATFWFEDGSFIKSRLFNSNYPNYIALLDVEGLNPWDLPEGLFAAIKTLEPFCTTGNVYFDNGFIYSDEYESKASSYKFEGIPDATAFNLKRFLQLEPYFTKAHFHKETNSVFVFGENIRGRLMEVHYKKAN
jgi:hypothetical protein